MMVLNVLLCINDDDSLIEMSWYIADSTVSFRLSTIARVDSLKLEVDSP